MSMTQAVPPSNIPPTWRGAPSGRRPRLTGWDSDDGQALVVVAVALLGSSRSFEGQRHVHITVTVRAPLGHADTINFKSVFRP